MPAAWADRPGARDARRPEPTAPARRMPAAWAGPAGRPRWPAVPGRAGPVARYW